MTLDFLRGRDRTRTARPRRRCGKQQPSGLLLSPRFPTRRNVYRDDCRFVVDGTGLEQQRKRPPPAAETGSRGWDSVLIFQSPAKGLRKNQQTQPVQAPAVRFRQGSQRLGMSTKKAPPAGAPFVLPQLGDTGQEQCKSEPFVKNKGRVSSWRWYPAFFASGMVFRLMVWYTRLNKSEFVEVSMIVPVDETNLLQAATIHSISWKESHRAFCTPDFIETHTPDRQREYLRNKMNNGTKLYMLVEEKTIGVVSVTKGLIEDLYILPDMQNMGYGTKLLLYAVGQCTDTSTLWILENNVNAERLYRRIGFKETGRKNAITNKLDEIEFALT